MPTAIADDLARQVTVIIDGDEYRLSPDEAARFGASLIDKAEKCREYGGDHVRDNEFRKAPPDAQQGLDAFERGDVSDDLCELLDEAGDCPDPGDVLNENDPLEW